MSTYPIKSAYLYLLGLALFSLYLCLQSGPTMITFMATLASAGAMAEIVFLRILRGRVALISYSWFWYVGTWTYFVTRV